MSSLRPGGDRGRERSSSQARSRSRSPLPATAKPARRDDGSSEESNSEEDEAVTMGGYADLPPEQRPDYQTRVPSGGVQYVQRPAQPTYTAQPQWGYNAPVQSGATPGLTYAVDPVRTGQQGQYQYAQMPAGVRYTAQPVRQPKPDPLPYQVADDPRFPSIGAYPSSPGAQPPYPGDGQFGQPGQPYGANTFSSIPPPPMGDHANRASPPELERKKSKDKSKKSKKDKTESPPMSPPLGMSSGRAYASGAVIKEVTPGNMMPPPNGRARGLSVNSSNAQIRAPSPGPGLMPGGGLGSRMNRLSVSGDRPDIKMIAPGGLPPGSPLLEAYRGTWQSMPGMPSPMMLPMDDDLDDIPSLDMHGRKPRSFEAQLIIPGQKDGKRDRSRSRSRVGRDKSPARITKEKKKVSMYDAETDAKDIADELARSHPNFSVIIDILPTLSHDQMLELRADYKRICKIQGRGINIAKHIKLKASGNFCKIAYVTALGRWESEGYWANFWYQQSSARRELLIESLMGRSNAEIRLIKDAFKDKRYHDSLSKCMDKELKADKFRTAVLMALEERKQEENDVLPVEYRNRDVDILYEALRRRDGGESAILNIVVTRSNAHLREVLKTYERKYQSNFAKEALRKSNNLVGEVIAHILNGVINRPARDAMLLHHAIIDLAPQKDSSTSTADRKDRYELLISRLVRLHWERLHFMRVKEDYRDKYGHYLEEDIEDFVKGEDFREFCLGICESAQR